MSFPPSPTSTDRKVRLFNNGILAAATAKHLNFIGQGITVADNPALRAHDVSFPGSTDEKVAIYSAGAQVGAVSRNLNFSPAFSTAEDVGNNRFDIGLAASGSTVLPDGSTTTKSKIGTFYGGSFGGNGLLAGMAIQGDDPSSELAAADMYTVFANSGGSDGDLAGFSTPLLMTRRDYNPTLRVRFKCNVTANENLFIGLINDVTTPAGATNPLDDMHGVALGFDEGDSKFIAWWCGGGSSPQKFTTGVNKDTAVHDLTITLDNAAARVIIIFDGATIVSSTTTPPAATTSLAAHVMVEDAGSDPALAVAWAYLIQDH